MVSGFIQVILSAVIFGTMPFFAKNIYAMGGNAVTLCVHRFGFSIPFLYLMARYGRRKSFALTLAQGKKLLVLSVSLAATPLLLFSSYNYISSGMATTLNFIYPVAVVAICALCYRERLERIKLFCCVLCVAGMLCFYTPGEKSGLLGMILALGSGITYAIYMVYYAKSGLAEMDSYVLTFYLSLFSSIILLGYALLRGELVFYSSPVTWGMAVFFAFMVSILATIFFQNGIRAVGPQTAGLLSTFEPLTGVLIGIMVFSEPMTPKIAGGILCILCSIILLTLSDRKR